MYAAIGTDGMRPVVWGVGDTAEAARADAETWADRNDGPGWDSEGGETVEITSEIAAEIKAGNVDSESLGIAVRVRDGVIVGATVRP